jgi:UDP-glucose 4-epimerase
LKKLLVTGGAGFIGSHLCEALVARGFNVTSLDDYSTGSKANHISGVEYIEGATENISAHIGFAPDIVFHLGEYSRVEQSFEDIEIVHRSNVNGTFRVLEFCREHGSKLVYAGSSTKFASDEEGQNHSPYAWTKAANTGLVRNYGDWFSLPYAITYFYNAYGAREIQDGKYATLIGIFTRKMRENDSLSVVSPGTQIRNFTHVDDIVSGLLLVGEKGEGDGYGIGCDEGYTVMEVAKMFGGQIDMLPPRKGNRMAAEVVTAKTKALGWVPKVRLVDYIAQLKSRNWL